MGIRYSAGWPCSRCVSSSSLIGFPRAIEAWPASAGNKHAIAYEYSAQHACEFPPFDTVFPLIQYDGIRCAPTARRADRAVLVDRRQKTANLRSQVTSGRPTSRQNAIGGGRVTRTWCRAVATRTRGNVYRPFVLSFGAAGAASLRASCLPPLHYVLSDLRLLTVLFTCVL